MSDQNDLISSIKLFLKGEKQAYDELYEKTIQSVYRNVHFLIDEKADIDDVIQDIYIEVYKSLRKYDCERPFKPWLMGIVIRQLQTYRRKRWMRLRISKKAEAEVAVQINVPDFSHDIIDKISNQQLVDLVNQLPYKLKQVVILRYLNDYSQEEVARILEIPIGTVKSRIHASLRKLNAKGKESQLFLEKVRNV
ncbi:RNA polymerase sigma factor [Peribacillus simplex]|uniref:Sigma-70 family RNA polymerase sigma factor n=1 Tax=Peribacillus simplex TaxID=1478 RepID=A0AAW7IB19_9BACI|nr:sigma-70 family RNA polymerase sigma factor [Peribacillus simplex]AMM94882.1 RNA polymerase sigma factor [Peribacillus simplex]MDM5451664.1 sigma-70 family RNA polymerase sigma factor [Peribacillus simplex]